MKISTWFLIWLTFAGFHCVRVVAAGSEQVEKYSFQPPLDLVRADVYALKTDWQPRALLVLCPGANGNGEGMVRQVQWQEFAKQEQVGLAGLAFASEPSLLCDCGRGYYCAAKGSGQALLDAIRKIYGRDLPVLLFGF